MTSNWTDPLYDGTVADMDEMFHYYCPANCQGTKAMCGYNDESTVADELVIDTDAKDCPVCVLALEDQGGRCLHCGVYANENGELKYD